MWKLRRRYRRRNVRSSSQYSDSEDILYYCYNSRLGMSLIRFRDSIPKLIIGREISLYKTTTKISE